MIILKSEIYSRFPVNKDFKYDLHEVISCPDCQHRLYAHGQCKRKVCRDKFGEKNKEPEIHHLLVMECRECHRTHRILPEDIIPNKRYDAETFSRICTEKLQASEQTYHGIFKAARGRYFGFNTDDGNFTPDENAKHIRYMYQAFVGGKTIAEIVRNLEGVKNNQGNSISSSQIRSILKSEVYKGDLHICKTPSRNVITGELDKVQYGEYWRRHHEAIIDEHTWELAKKRFEEQSSKKGVAKMRDEDVLIYIFF